MIKTTSIVTGLLFCFSILLIFQYCTSTGTQNHDSTEDISNLLVRSEKLQHGLEWDQIQNLYGQLRDKINGADDDEARLTLAKLFIKEARVTGEHGHYYPAALKSLNQILLKPDLKKDIKFRTLTTKAGVELSLHEFNDALKTAEEAYALNNRNAQIHGVLVDAHVELGNYDEAVKFADKMISIKPDLRSYSRVSYLREIHGDNAGALEAMKLAVDAGYPGLEETAWAALTLGEMYLEENNIDQAFSIFEDILESRTDYPFAIAALGEVYLAKNDLTAAESKFKDAIEVIPEIGFYLSLAKIYKDQGRTEELEQIKPEIWEMLEDDVVNGHNMNLEYASIYTELFPDYDKALAYAMTEYEKRPKNIDVNRALAKIYLKKNDSEKATIHFELAGTTGSEHPELKEISDELYSSI